MRILVSSAFRDTSDEQIRRWCAQIVALKKHVGPSHEVSAQATEGDSKDDTAERVLRTARAHLIDIRTVTADTGKPHLGSVEHPVRLAVMSEVLDKCFAAIATGWEYDVVVHVESDLIWDPETIGALIDIAWERRHGIDVVVPMIFAGSNFYDVWAYRYQGHRFGPFPPFCHALRGQPFLELDSAGSCVVTRWAVIREVQGCQDEALVGWCKHARKKGLKIAVASYLSVRHPA